MLGDAVAKLVASIPLSNNTVQRQITDMSNNIEETLLDRPCKSDMYALQLDKSANISKKSNNVGFHMISLRGQDI